MIQLFQGMMSPASSLPYEPSRIASPPPSTTDSRASPPCDGCWPPSDQCGHATQHNPYGPHPRHSWASTNASTGGQWPSAYQNQHLPSRSPTPADSPPGSTQDQHWSEHYPRGIIFHLFVKFVFLLQPFLVFGSFWRRKSRRRLEISEMSRSKSRDLFWERVLYRNLSIF